MPRAKTAQPNTEAKIKEKKEKSTADDAKFAEGIALCIKQNYISDFSSINNKKIHDRLSTQLGKYILEHIKTIRETEVQAGLMEDTFPVERYTTLDDQVAPKKTKRAVVITGGAKPVKQTLPPVLVDDDEEVNNEEPAEETEVAEETPEEAVVETKEETPTQNDQDKESKRTSPVKYVKTAKAWLGFIVNRYLTEYYNLKVGENGKTVKTDDEFVRFTCSATVKRFSSRLSRSIALTVYRLGSHVDNMSEHGLVSDLRALYEEPMTGKKVDPRPKLLEIMIRYLVQYFKLMGVFLGNMLWCQKGGMITGENIEQAMRNLDIGNEQFALSNGFFVPSDGVEFNGLTSGILAQARYHTKVIFPEVVKKAPAKRKAKETKTDEPATDAANDAAVGETEPDATEPDTVEQDAAEQDTADTNQSDQSEEVDINIVEEPPAKPVKAAPAKKPVKVEPVKTEPVKAEPVKAEPAKRVRVMKPTA